MQLRPYQTAAVDSIFAAFGNGMRAPILSLPTASGKSVIQAAFLQRALAAYPDEHFLLVTHRKELLAQNATRIVEAWPDAPVGVYSAGLGRRELAQITVAGVQSVYRRANELPTPGVVIIDECHLVPRDGCGMYRTLLDGLRQRNPDLCLVGMTATPFRLDSGRLDDGEGALFDGTVYEADLLSLIADGYLCDLVSRIGATSINVDGVHVRGGEYVEAELQARLDQPERVTNAADEAVKLCGDRAAWLVFCCGVKHAQHVAAALVERGIPAACVWGDMPSDERARTLDRFHAGELRALTNVDLLTTGYDEPRIDAIIGLRPTMSTGLYVQMAGRGMRLHPDKRDCAYLDFAGNIERHGPLTALRIRTEGNSARYSAITVKACPRCRLAVPIAATTCPECGYVFKRELPRNIRHDSIPADVDILGRDNFVTMHVDAVEYVRHQKTGRPDSLRVIYYGTTIGPYARRRVFSEWVCIEHPGYAGVKAQRWLDDRGAHGITTVDEALAVADMLPHSEVLIVDVSGKYAEIKTRRGLVQPAQGEI